MGDRWQLSERQGWVKLGGVTHATIWLRSRSIKKDSPFIEEVQAVAIEFGLDTFVLNTQQDLRARIERLLNGQSRS